MTKRKFYADAVLAEFGAKVVGVSGSSHVIIELTTVSGRTARTHTSLTPSDRRTVPNLRSQLRKLKNEAYP